MSTDHLQWWSNLLHGGMLLDPQRLSDLVSELPAPIGEYDQQRLRLKLIAFNDDPSDLRGSFVAYILQDICGFVNGQWLRGSNIPSAWTRRGLSGEAIRPSHLWLGPHEATLPVFIDDHKRVGIGQGRRFYSQVLQWLRKTDLHLAVVTNGFQWRIVYAGLDYDAFSQWDVNQWLREGQPSPELSGFRALCSPLMCAPPETGKTPPLIAAVNDSRKGQADLSKTLGERVRQAVEVLIQAHTPVLNSNMHAFSSSDIYRAAVRMIMRMVVILFAESREGLLPKDNPIYHSAYSLSGLRDLLERTGSHKLRDSYGAYPRLLALIQLIYRGSDHEALPITAYGGDLFAPGHADNDDGMKHVLHLFETACFDGEIMSDYDMVRVLDLLTRTQIKIRQGRTATWITAPVDFSSLDSEYMGILYEGLLDFELRSAAEGEPVVFLSVGDQPALPLSILEQMQDSAIKSLFKNLKESPTDDDKEDSELELDEFPEYDEEDDLSDELPVATEEQTADDPRFTLQARAERWARRACEVANLVNKPRGKMNPEKEMQFEQALNTKARQLVVKVVLPGEWYLVRWGGTRKGSGTFYTRPQLANPTVHRTLRPLVFDPPDDKVDVTGEQAGWIPKKPEEILGLKVCDPACGSGAFCLAALRFITDALFESLSVHNRIRDHGGRAVLDLIYDEHADVALSDESLWCRPDDDNFEHWTKALLRRYVVERCIYGVDLDPLAVELCRLSLWIETLDRQLPMTFLDHKIKVGNSLVGAWFDQFSHYPAMAWEREGGDSNHTNGVHYPQDQWTRAVKEMRKAVKKDLIGYLETHGTLFNRINNDAVQLTHAAARSALREIHELGIDQITERADKYQELRTKADFQRLMEAFDLWCALWFWPADELTEAPRPPEFLNDALPEESFELVRRLADQHKFFHWELEFPDVFSDASSGFDAVVGNPPWDTLQPSSKEFFSAFDLLYRGYGKQEAIHKQTEYFAGNRELEREWLLYNAQFKSMSNWVKYSGFPFGDRVTYNAKGTGQHDLNLGSGGKSSFEKSQQRHELWKSERKKSLGYVDEGHVFRYQGTGKSYTYKLFLEQAHALLVKNGRLGMIVPSGIYSDHGTGDLRELFIDSCSWEWLFGFENRDKIFDIDGRFKFNPIIIAKGGETSEIHTAFMRWDMADWERAEQIAIKYPRKQIHQFSPNSRAILEIQSQRDLEVLAKIYANSVMLGDQSDKGWGIRYAQGDFNMTSDSRLFPPRPKWEEWGYQPDEYSRWIKGPWKPIGELYAEMGVKPLAEGESRCAQPPYDRLAVPRADIPAGIILSREADAWIREDEIPTVTFTDATGKPLKIKRKGDLGKKVEVEVMGPAIALPLYEGRMIGQYNFSKKGWVSGKGRGAVWHRVRWEAKFLEPQFLTPELVIKTVNPLVGHSRPMIMRITSATNTRTIHASLVKLVAGEANTPILQPASNTNSPLLIGILNSFAFDYLMRKRMGGLTADWHFLSQVALVSYTAIPLVVTENVMRLTCISSIFSPEWIRLRPEDDRSLRRCYAITHHERVRLETIINSIVMAHYHLSLDDAALILSECDHAEVRSVGRSLDPKGFWRVDKDKHPEHRLTVLSLVAFHDLQDKIASCQGDVSRGIEAFCSQNNGEGWMLPETLRLADYGLGHDDRAKQHQPVRECFGPRFYDWQLAQSPEESWQECHLHARNLLGKEGYQQLLDEIEGKEQPQPQEDLRLVAESPAQYKSTLVQSTIFEPEQ